MKTLLKKNLFFSCLVVLLCFGLTAVSYGQAVVSVDPSEVGLPAAGSQLTISLQITNARNVAGYQLTVNFDTSVLRYVSGANGGYLPAGAFFAPPRAAGGKVTLAATSVSGAARGASGTLARVTFSVVSPKRSTLRLTDATLSDSNGNSLSVRTRNGNVVEGDVSLKTDVNRDGVVDVLDMTRVAARIGARDASADTNGDGIVNVFDLVLVAQDLGKDDKKILPPPDGMVLIPAGEFEMGSNDAEAANNEQPVRTVFVDAFYMDKHEVTNVEYKEFLLENPRWQKGRVEARFANANYLKLWNGNNYPSGKGNHPVADVSWYAAMAYAEWADKRLPTEAEWEYAARGGEAGWKYPHGNTITARNANYGNNAKGTTPVGDYAANGYGLYDMAGNVLEWCLDEFDRDFYFTFPRNGIARNLLSGAPSVEWLLDNYTGVNTRRTMRGGAWVRSTQLVRVTQRFFVSPTGSIRGNELGFRCVREAVTP